MKLLMTAVMPLMLLAGPAFAQEAIEEPASAEETAAIVAVMATMKCELPPNGVVEKENDNLFEVDDALCGFGQYDLKFDGGNNLLNMTYDGPRDENGQTVQADPDIFEEIQTFLAGIGCRAEADEVEAESQTLFEIDDGECDYGEFDIKLGREGGEWIVRSMTRD